jgi:hypothetical protein
LIWFGHYYNNLYVYYKSFRQKEAKIMGIDLRKGYVAFI